MNSQTIEKMKEMRLYGMARAMASAIDMGIKISRQISLSLTLWMLNGMTATIGGLKD